MTTSIEADIASLKEAHPSWKEDQIRAILEFVERGHCWEVSKEKDANKTPDRAHRQEMRDMEARFLKLGIPANLVSVKWDQEKKLYLHLDDKLTFTPAELELITQHVAERKAEKMARLAALPADEKLIRAVSNYMQSLATDPKNLDNMPPLISGHGKGLSFLTEEGNTEKYRHWVRHHLGRFFSNGLAPKLSLIEPKEGDGFLGKQKMIVMDTADIRDKDLNMPRIMEWLQSPPETPMWGEILTAHHQRLAGMGGKPILQPNTEKPPTNIVRELHHALNCAVEALANNDGSTMPTTPSLMEIGGKQLLVFKSEEANAALHQDIISQVILPRFFKEGAIPALEIIASTSEIPKLQQGEVGIALDISAVQEANFKMDAIKELADKETGGKSWRILQRDHKARLPSAASLV